MLNDAINRISDAYITEAKNSPNLMEDMAAMEKYLAESYGGRVFAELLQNADDCGSTRVFSEQYCSHFIFANNGRPFDEKDIISISRSGASKKERGTQIGYRGIGFKSTSCLTEEIIIYSDETFFTFSKSECAKKLNKPNEKIPTVRIPFLVNDISNELYQHILDISKQYTTIFIFKNAKISQLKEEIGGLTCDYFMFLRNISTCTIQMSDLKIDFEIYRKTVNENEVLTFKGEEKQQWLIIRKDNIALAMKLISGRIMPCESYESIYHCFLPTLDKTPYPFKINADFSTDPSRKHIIQDSLTNNAIEEVALLIYNILTNAIEKQDAIYSQIIDIIMAISSFSPINQKLTNCLDDLIKSKLALICSDGTQKLISSIKSLPDYFENSEKNVLRTKSGMISGKSIEEKYYKTFSSMEAFLDKYSDNSFSPEEISQVLSEKSFIESLDSQMYARIFAFVAASIKIAKLTNSNHKVNDSILIPTNIGAVNAKELKDQKIAIKDDVKRAIFESTRSNDLQLFCDYIGVACDKIKPYDYSIKGRATPSTVNDNVVNLKYPAISKWRSAEQQCMELEAFWGNIVIDVSKQNIGYDIESTKPDGTKRFIEVKLLSNPRASFSLTNNEYTAAYQYGETYYICLIFQGEHTANILYINNPLKRVKFAKRVRQWEWYCEEYSGEEYVIDLR